MIVYWTAALAALFYFTQIPVRLALRLRVGEENTLRFGVGLFAARPHAFPALPITEKLLADSRARFRAMKKPPLRAALFLLRCLRVDGLRVTARIGASDAARTALLAGGMVAVTEALGHAFPGRVRAAITPDFARASAEIRLGGIISVRTGQIMRAAALALWIDLNGRLHKWTGIRLKVS